jgi:hypothetical protein
MTEAQAKERAIALLRSDGADPGMFASVTVCFHGANSVFKKATWSVVCIPVPQPGEGELFITSGAQTIIHVDDATGAASFS